MPDVLVFSLDYDGCFDTPERLIKLKELIKDHVNKRGVKKVRLIMGSQRHDLWKDLYNSLRYKNPSAFISMNSLYDELKKELGAKKIEVILDQYLLSDESDKIGDQYNKILDFYSLVGKLREKYKNLNNKCLLDLVREGKTPKGLEKKLEQEDLAQLLNQVKTIRLTPFRDEIKLLLLYLQIHRVASRYPDKTIDFIFVDDSRVIIYAVFTLFSEDNGVELLPYNVLFSCYAFECIKNGVNLPTKRIVSYDKDFKTSENLDEGLQGVGDINTKII
jgi:hypothetical protein